MKKNHETGKMNASWIFDVIEELMLFLDVIMLT